MKAHARTARIHLIVFALVVASLLGTLAAVVQLSRVPEIRSSWGSPLTATVTRVGLESHASRGGPNFRDVEATFTVNGVRRTVTGTGTEPVAVGDQLPVYVRTNGDTRLLSTPDDDWKPWLVSEVLAGLLFMPLLLLGAYLLVLGLDAAWGRVERRHNAELQE